MYYMDTDSFTGHIKTFCTKRFFAEFTGDVKTRFDLYNKL